MSTAELKRTYEEVLEVLGIDFNKPSKEIIYDCGKMLTLCKDRFSKEIREIQVENEAERHQEVSVGEKIENFRNALRKFEDKIYADDWL